MIKKEILQDLDGDDLTPPPYWIMMHLLSSAPPASETALMPIQGKVKFLQQPLLFTSSPGDCRAAISAGSDPRNGDLWSTPPEFHLSRTS